MTAATTPSSAARSVALVTLGCTRNEVDSEELAGRLAAEGWTLVDDAADADVAVVNTCGFVEQAKKDSIDALLEAADLKETGRTQAVVAVGCLAERYGEHLAAELPEADAVLGFDSYRRHVQPPHRHPRRARPASHVPSDRRRLLPLSPPPPAAARWPARHGGGRRTPGHGATACREPGASRDHRRAGPASGPRVIRPGSTAAVGAAEDRQRLRPAVLVLRHPDVPRRRSSPAARPTCIAEARWLGEQRRQELFLVSENSTSYGKDLGDLRCSRRCCPSWPRSRASSGCGCPTCSRPRSGPACST